MSTLGWCLDGHHAPSKTSVGCPAILPEAQHPDPARRGSTYTIPERRCNCPCHARPIDSTIENTNEEN